jgi:DNA-binding Lrp family transcriptional regulator
MSENLKIDNLDRKILDIITKNARIPYLEVARECNVSGAAIHQRVQRLIKIGVISYASCLAFAVIGNIGILSQAQHKINKSV